MKRYQTFEWYRMPKPLRNIFSEHYEHMFGHYTYVKWDSGGLWGFDTDEGQKLEQDVNDWLKTEGLELENGKIPDTVLILIDW